MHRTQFLKLLVPSRKQSMCHSSSHLLLTSLLSQYLFIYLIEFLVLGSADGSSLDLIPYSHNAEVLKIDNPMEYTRIMWAFKTISQVS